MINADELIKTFYIPLNEKGGYIFGKSGQKWTQAQQDAATRPQTVSYGQKWVGHRVWDCSGMFVWAYKQFGESIYHGSNTIWRSYCSKQGKLQNGQRCDGIALRPGTAVFLLNDTGRHHIGLYVGDNTVIEAKGTKHGIVTSKPTHWDEWGELKQVDYSMFPEEVIPLIRPTLKKGDRGDEVKTLQSKLVECGYVLTVDGAFGSKTEAAVKMFQRNAGLNPDGIVGPKTWAELDEAINTKLPFDDPEPIEPDEDIEEDIDEDIEQLKIDREKLSEWREQLSEIIDEIDRILQ